MIKKWDMVREQVKSAERDDPKTKSQTKHLLLIIDRAEAWEIDPGVAAGTGISNLTEIIREAKRAIKKDNKEYLVMLFQWASELTNKELRIRLRGEDREEIAVNIKSSKLGPIYNFKVSKDQFDRIQRSTVEYYIYNVKEEENVLKNGQTNH